MPESEMARVSRSRMILTACGTQQTVVSSAPVAPIASTTTGGIVPRLICLTASRCRRKLGPGTLKLGNSCLANHFSILTTARCDQDDKWPARENNDARLILLTAK